MPNFSKLSSQNQAARSAQNAAAGKEYNIGKHEAKNKMQSEKEKVHSEMLRAGGKTYFFDVKKTSRGDNYLTIAESYLDKDGKKVVNRILIFKDQFADFGNTIFGLKTYF